jgi:N-acetyl-anhydromuramyl-L-alanine amidase AmpD
MRTIDKIILHCSASPNGKDFDVKDCDNWHLERGFRRKETERLLFNPHLFAVGYHYWIKIDGTIQSGRQVSEVGAHCAGLNSTSIGLCMVGTDKFTTFQWSALEELVRMLGLTYPGINNVIGHYQTPTGIAQGKKCPEFDVEKWMESSYTTPKEHLLT